MNNGSPRRPVSGRGLPLLICHFIAEMGMGICDFSYFQKQQ
ncbi:MAG: hypothetical protein OQK03_02220 [Colwellia sp.]|nr:hypothetical protein [Colwellia sp.]